MSRSSKNKKSKVPKITEEDYAAYLTALKSPTPPSATQPTCASALENNVRGVAEVRKP